MRDDIKWECPKCGEENIDNPDATSFPMCSACEKCFNWEDVTEDNND